jgi:hypothetical protein
MLTRTFLGAPSCFQCPELFPSLATSFARGVCVQGGMVCAALCVLICVCVCVCA